jgi:hypothetical protein
MSLELRGSIRRNLERKETDELLEIWRANRRFEWSDTAFEVIEAILRERTASLPEQGEPVHEQPESPAVDDDGLEPWEARLLDDPDQPEFYDPLEVLTLKDNLNRTAKASIVVYAALGLWTLPLLRRIFSGMIYASEWPGLLMVSAVFVLATGLQIAITYTSLKALAHILRILMEMEFNSRKPG